MKYIQFDESLEMNSEAVTRTNNVSRCLKDLSHVVKLDHLKWIVCLSNQETDMEKTNVTN